MWWVNGSIGCQPPRCPQHPLSDESSGSPEFDPARGIGLIGSSSTSTSGLLAEDAAEAANGLLDDSGESEAEAIPTGDFTARFALLNCDWDNMRAVDLFALADSFKPDLGSVLSVRFFFFFFFFSLMSVFWYFFWFACLLTTYHSPNHNPDPPRAR